MIIRILYVIFLFIFGSNIYGFELINSKTIVSPGCEGGILEMTMHTLPWLEKDNRTIGISTSAKATVHSVNGKKGSVVRLSSTHKFSMYNGTKKTARFRIAVKLYTHDGQSTYNEQTQDLGPNASYTSTLKLYLAKEYLQEGNFLIFASTIISGADYCSDNDVDGAIIR